MTYRIALRFPLLLLAAVMWTLEPAFAGVIFSDNFNDNTVNSLVWSNWGSSVVESGQIMQILQNVTDAGGNLKSKPIPINANGAITITRRVYLHHHESFSYMGKYHFFWGKMFIQFGDLPKVGIHYDDLDYDIFPDDARAMHGFFISRNGVGEPYLLSVQGDVSAVITPVWDTWFDEKITYDPVSGLLGYYINNTLQLIYDVGALPASISSKMTLSMDSYGWWTGHEHLMDNLVITQDGSVAAVSTNAAAANIRATVRTDGCSASRRWGHFHGEWGNTIVG